MTRPARPPGRAARAVVAVLVGWVGLAVVAGPPAAGQQSPLPVPGNALALISQTAWVTATDTEFRMDLTITAADPTNTRVAVTVYQRLFTRSDFNESVLGRIHTARRHSFTAHTIADTPSDATGGYLVDLPINPSLGEGLDVQSPGVYPVAVQLIDPDNRILAQLVTHLLYTGASTVAQPRLDVAWILPFEAPPVLTGGRTDRLPADKAQPLSGLADALAQNPQFPVTLAPTAQTLEALAQGVSVDRATVKTLAQVAAEPTTEVVNRPYVALNLPAVVASGLDGEWSAEVRKAGEILGTTLHVRPDTRTWVEPGPLDPPSVDDLIGRGVDQLVVDANVLSPLPSDLRNSTLAQPFTLLGRGGRQVTALAADDGLASHFVAGGDQVLAAHQLLADMAMIQQERPADLRGVALLTPASWQPNAAFLREVLAGLGTSPWLAPVRLDRLFAEVPAAQEHRARLQRSLVVQRAAAPLADAAAILVARHRLDDFASMLPAGSNLYAAFEGPLLLGQSADLSQPQRSAERAVVSRLIDGQISKVRLPANTSITLTARQGRFPVTIVSTAPYRPRVKIRLSSSQKLVFQPIGGVGASCQSAGSVETCLLDLRTQFTTLKVPVLARTAGVFTMTIQLVTPDEGLIVATSHDTVRSTAASGVGVLLSIGAAFLLVLWWVRDLRHGRRARGLVPAASGGPPLDDVTVDGWGGPGPGGPGGDDWLLGDLGVKVGPAPPSRRRGASSLPAARDQGPRMATAVLHDRVGASPSATTRVGSRPPRRHGAASPRHDQPASFFRNTAVMTSGTILSRITGLARVLALVYAFGQKNRLSDIYTLANTAPNILYDLLLGGVLSATLVPVFVDWFGRDDEEAWRAVSAVVTAITVALAALTALFWLVAPVIIRLYLVLSPNVVDQRALGTTLLRMFVPQLFLLGGIAVTTALLSARRQFFAVAYSPIVLNVVTVAAIVGARLVAGTNDLSAFRRNTVALVILGLGTTAGYLFQLLAQVPSLIRGGWRLRPVWDPHHPAVRTVLRLSMWTLGSVVANQIAYNLVLIVAARRTGDVVAFQLAFQFFQLPHAIFAVSIAAVLTPDLSELWTRADVEAFRRRLAGGLRLTLAIIVPAAVGSVLLAQPAMAMFFRHRGLSTSDPHLIGTTVALFAVGLPGFSAYQLFMRAYQAMQDTRSMFWLYAFENGLTMVLAVALYPSLGVGGLALAWVGAYSFGAIVAYVYLRRRTAGLEGRATAVSCGRIVLASAVMAVAVELVLRFKSSSSGLVTPRVLVASAVGAGVYLVAGRSLGVVEVGALGDLRRGPR